MNQILDKPSSRYEIQIDDNWETLVSQGMEAREQKDNSQWKLGFLADKVNVRYGQNSVGQFAATIGVNKRSLLRYRDVYRVFKDQRIDPSLSFSHYLKVSALPDPLPFLERASVEGWSVEKLGLEIDSKRPKNVCQVCGLPKIKSCQCKDGIDK